MGHAVNNNLKKGREREGGGRERGWGLRSGRMWKMLQ